MINKMFFSLSMVFLLTLLSYASDEGLKETSHGTEHEYTFTEVMGDYHVNLIVEHAYSTMFLKTTDIHEKPIKLLQLQSIKGKVIFPDGTVNDVLFMPSKTISSKKHSRQRAESYEAHGEWIKTTPAFTLKVTIPVEGKSYNLTFDYKVPGGKIKIPVHEHHRH